MRLLDVEVNFVSLECRPGWKNIQNVITRSGYVITYPAHGKHKVSVSDRWLLVLVGSLLPFQRVCFGQLIGWVVSVDFPILMKIKTRVRKTKRIRKIDFAKWRTRSVVLLPGQSQYLAHSNRADCRQNMDSIGVWIFFYCWCTSDHWTQSQRQ